MYRQLSEASELGDFFRQQVLMIMFIIKFAEQMERLTNLLVLQAFFREMGQHLDDDEAIAVLMLIMAMTGQSAQQRPTGGAVAAQRPPQRQALPEPARPALRALPAPTSSNANTPARGYQQTASRPAPASAPAPRPASTAGNRYRQQPPKDTCCCALL